MGLLEGKVALITGGARGQGRAHALISAREGADVIAFDVPRSDTTVAYPLADADDMAETERLVEEQGRKILCVEGDVRAQKDIDDAVRRGLEVFGTIDILIANAGVFSHAPLWEISDAVWDEMIAVNLTGVWHAIKAVAPTMIAKKSGSIVVTTSVSAYEPSVGYGHYTASKHGAEGLMKNAALELAPHGVRCNAVAPAGVKTPMVNNPSTWAMVAGHEGGTEEELDFLGYHGFMLRGQGLLKPQSVAEAVLFLNSSQAASITGVSIPVDGGHLLPPGMNPAPWRPSDEV